MQQVVPIGELKVRCEAINLSLKRIAQRAAVDPATCYRAARGSGDTLSSTQAKLSAALLAEELRLLRHLLDLHGVPQHGSEAETVPVAPA